MELFGTTGQERRAWLDNTLNSTLNKYLGPTGIPDRLNAVNNVLNPVVGIEQSAQHTKNALNADMPDQERMFAAAQALLEVAGVAAPVAAHKVAGKSAD